MLERFRLGAMRFFRKLPPAAPHRVRDFTPRTYETDVSVIYSSVLLCLPYFQHAPSIPIIVGVGNGRHTLLIGLS